MINEEVRNFLIDTARHKKTTDYTKLNKECNLGLDMSLISDRNKIAEILGNILIYEFSNKRPLLSVLVTHKNDNEVGNGFWRILRKIGITTKNEQDRLEFTAKETKRCHEYWHNKKY